MRIAVTILAGMMAGGCATQPAPFAPMANLVFLTRDGCTNTTTMRANLDAALKVLGQPADYAVVDLETLADSDARRGYPTPTVLVSNRDLFGMAEPRRPYPDPT